MDSDDNLTERVEDAMNKAKIRRAPDDPDIKLNTEYDVSTLIKKLIKNSNTKIIVTRSMVRDFDGVSCTFVMFDNMDDIYSYLIDAIRDGYELNPTKNFSDGDMITCYEDSDLIADTLAVYLDGYGITAQEYNALLKKLQVYYKSKGKKLRYL